MGRVSPDNKREKESQTRGGGGCAVSRVTCRDQSARTNGGRRQRVLLRLITNPFRTRPLSLSFSLARSLSRSLFRDHDTSALSLFHLSPSSPFPPAIIPRFIKACTDVNERGNCSLASFHCVAFRVFPPCLNGF